MKPPPEKMGPPIGSGGPERNDAIRFPEYPPLSNGATCNRNAERSDDRDLTFYFAGKISKTDWRHSLVHDLRNAGLYDDEAGTFRCRPILRNAIGQGLHYSGPHFKRL
jgi:hypothetical protein